MCLPLSFVDMHYLSVEVQNHISIYIKDVFDSTKLDSNKNRATELLNNDSVFESEPVLATKNIWKLSPSFKPLLFNVFLQMLKI